MKKEIEKFEKRQKSLYYGVEFTNGIRRAVVIALMLLYFLSFGFSLVSITSLFAISGIVAMVFEFITGPIADHVSRKLSILISFLLMGVAYLGLFLSKSFILLAIFYILNDIAWTFQSGASNAWIIDALNYGRDKFKLVRLFSRVYFFEKSGRVIGSLIAFFIVAINFRFIWLFIALLNFIMFFILVAYMEEKNFKKDKTQKNLILKTILKVRESFVFILHSKNRQALGLIISMFITTFFATAFFTFVPVVFKNNYNLTPSNISGLFTLMGIFFLLGPFIGEWGARKIGIRKSFLYSFLIVALGIFIFTLTNSLIIAASAFTILETIAIGTDVLYDTSIHNRISSKIRASMGSVQSLVWNVATSLSVFLAGFSVLKFGLVNTLIITGVLSIVTAFSYWISLRD